MNTYSNHLKILRKPEVLALLGLSETSLHRQIKAGTFPPSFSLGCRAVGWYEHELTSVIKARAAAKTENEIIAIVQRLVASRKQEI
ncbi:AlpA family phage regulatory protein [Shewanella maritima]|uniref:AlpA family phage regulatory protein n=1 Tax=Shewanella maritima TaxID=2520507 RepID=A0A411PEJ3_9GAMM|nr:AlpA family phage regulatory protein [Shewanella maritima]QBF81961.1 AlpA family phage regulatory protein [Shewanella maritima]